MAMDSGEGMRWAVDPPPHYSEPDDVQLDEQHVEGSVIRFMCDYGIDMPLWDEGGPLPNDLEWLNRELSLSTKLVSELAAWAADWDGPGTNDPVMLREWIGRRSEHTDQGRRLFDRLRSEVPDRFSVVNRG